MGRELSQCIKDLRKQKGYTQKELAGFLKIGQTAIANYEQGTRVPDTEKLRKIADFFEVSTDYLLGRNEKISCLKKVKISNLDFEDCSKTYLDSLIEGNKEYARNLIMNLYEEGLELEYIYFNILEKALKRIGGLWESGSIEIWQEHFISETTTDIMKEIKIKESKNVKSRFGNNSHTIILLNSGSEFHNIGIKMISDILEIEGFNTIYLGSNVPVQSLINAIELKRPKFVAISTTIPYNIDSSINMINAIKSYFRNKAPKIIIGGLAFINLDDVCVITGADYYSTGINHIREVLKQYNNI